MWSFIDMKTQKAFNIGISNIHYLVYELVFLIVISSLRVLRPYRITLDLL